MGNELKNILKSKAAWAVIVLGCGLLITGVQATLFKLADDRYLSTTTFNAHVEEQHEDEEAIKQLLSQWQLKSDLNKDTLIQIKTDIEWIKQAIAENK